ncbi:hypothetical protein ACRQ1B_23980 [Rhizobium panacihumi]
MGTNTGRGNIAYIVLRILLVVFLFNTVPNAIRSRLIGGEMHWN